MTITDIFKDSHAAVDPTKLVKASTVFEEEMASSKSKFDEAIEFMGIDPEHVYFDRTNRMDPFFYWNEYIYISLHFLDVEVLKMFRANEKAKALKEYVEMLKASDNYVKLFSVCEKKIIIPMFKEKHMEIPEEIRYDVFADVYTRSEYGFGQFDKDLYDNVFSLRHHSKEWKERMDAFSKTRILRKGKILVYRGQNEESTPTEVAISWTLNKNVAKFFAERFDGNGHVVNKRIEENQVLDFLDDRNEKEVLIMP